MWTLQMAKALALSALLMTILVRLREPDLWRLMVAGVLGLVVVRSFLNRRFWPDLNPRYRPELVWRLSLLVAGVVLVVALVLMAFLRPQPDFTEASLAQAVWHQVDQEAVRSGVLHEALRLLAAKDGVQLWLAQNLGELPVAGWPIVVLVWLMVFVEQALFVTALLLLCNGVLSRLPPEAIGGAYAQES
jgi:antibiotic biosynthesis monooxygenase (ABM) superfamily enzyme